MSLKIKETKEIEKNSPVKNSGQANNMYIIASSIIVAGLIIAGAVVYQNNSSENTSSPSSLSEKTSINVKAVSPADHILGNIDAPVKIIEFSDLECPACKFFHQAMRDGIIDEYINTNKVVWVYRHYPLDNPHPKARAEAEASECVAALAGNDAFWQYIDKIFAVTPSNNGLDLELLNSIAAEIGFDQGQQFLFTECRRDNLYRDQVNADMADGLRAGLEGTPYIIIIDAAGNFNPINGTLPAASLRLILDDALAVK